MSEFELSTLVMVVMLLVVLGGYSYWQIARAQRAQRKSYELENQAYFDQMEEDFGDELPLVLNKSNTKTEFVVSKAFANATLPEQSEVSLSTAHSAGVVQFRPSEIDSELAPDVVVFEESFTRSTIKESPVIEQIEDIVVPASEQSTEFTAKSVAEEMIDAHVLPQAVNIESTSVAPVNDAAQRSLEAVSEETPVMTFSEDEALMDSSTAKVISPQATPVADPQFFTQRDVTEQATIRVFEPLIRFATWIEGSQPQVVQYIDGQVDIIVNQPKTTQDIEKALEDLHLDTDLSLRLFGLRAGQVAAKDSDDPNSARKWQPLEAGVLYSGLRLTLQLANASTFANSDLILEWFELAKRFAKRLAAHVSVWPNPDSLARYAMNLHEVANHLGAPLLVQLRKPQGLWAGYEIHQQMTQWGLQLDANGQYVARHNDGQILYRVINDLTNPRAQEFYRDGLASMHVQTLSFCVDLAHIHASYVPEQRMWHDMSQLANALQAQWCNEAGQIISAETLFAHAAEHVPEYLRQLNTLGVPAGSLVMRRLLQKFSK